MYKLISKKGFSLVEILVVVSIIGILATIAIPSYKAHTVRAQLAEAITLFGPVKAEIQDFYNQQGRLPRASELRVVGELGGSGPTAVNSSVVQNVSVYDDLGNISPLRFEVQINPNIFPSGVLTSNQPLVQLWPAVDAATETITWKCGTSPSGAGAKHIPLRFLPSGCRDIVS